jgi:tRNA pseudouridine38-40 synthase
MPHFKLTLAYDGAPFVGWQRQAEGTSIQGIVEEALAALDGREVVVTGASRTDAGVHALGQVAGCELNRDVDGHTVIRALNARLPPTVRVLQAIEVARSFHARFDATAKTYRYRIWNHEVLGPFERATVWHVPVPPLDATAMDAAARSLEGRHDFAAFQATGAPTASTERVVFASRVFIEASRLESDRSVVVYEVRGEGFLRHMVRTIVGTLVDVGRGRQPAESVREVLQSGDRSRVGRTAPAAGLFLVRVDYE